MTTPSAELHAPRITLTRTYRWLAALSWPKSYSARITALALCAAYLPFAAATPVLAAIAPDILEFPALALFASSALVGGGFIALAVHTALSPVRLSARSLLAYAEGRTLPDLPTGYVDEAGMLMREVQGTIAGCERAIAELGRRADTDTLTGLANRRCFFARASEEMSRARRNGDCVSLIVFDIDHFKAINDTHGHAAGDSVLRLLAGAVARQLRVYDGFSRIGGEEFAIVLPGAQIQDAVGVAERLRASLGAMELPVIGRPVTASFGVASLKATDRSVDDLLHRADLVLYDAKGGGRNRVTWRSHEDEMEALPEPAAGVSLAMASRELRVWEID